MLTRTSFGSIRRVLVAGLMAAGLLVWTGCFGANAGGVNAVLKALVEELELETGANAIIIRIANESAGLTEQIDLRIDGKLETFTCEAERAICDKALNGFPTLIEAIEERRLDEDGAYQGGRSLEGYAEFTFTADDLQPGSIIVFDLSESSAEAFVL